MNQISLKLGKQAIRNANIIKSWIESTEKSIVQLVNSGKLITSAFYSLINNTETGIFETRIIMDFDIDDKSYSNLIKQNYLNGFPLMAAITLIPLESVEFNGKSERVILLYIQTPLTRFRKVYIYQNIEGKDKLLFDGLLTNFIVVPKQVSQFAYILDCGCTHSLS